MDKNCISRLLFIVTGLTQQQGYPRYHAYYAQEKKIKESRKKTEKTGVGQDDSSVGDSDQKEAARVPMNQSEPTAVDKQSKQGSLHRGSEAEPANQSEQTLPPELLTSHAQKDSAGVPVRSVPMDTHGIPASTASSETDPRLYGIPATLWTPQQGCQNLGLPVFPSVHNMYY